MTQTPQVLVLGVGNTVLTDDGVGVYAARRARDLNDDPRIEVKEAELGGFALVDLFDGYDGLVVVDALAGSGGAPGAITMIDGASFEPTSHLSAGHQIDLPTALALSEKLGQHPPQQVRIVCVAVEDDMTMGERCTPAVEAAIAPAAKRALELARELIS